MKKIIYISFFSFFVLMPFLYFTYSPFTAFLNTYIYFSSCDAPLNYRIGFIDSRFNIAQDEFLQDIKDGEAIWENINAKNMFDYDAQGELSFNLKYDNRQSLNTQIGELEGKLDNGKSILESNIEDYENLVDQFNQRRKNSNEKISYWNSQGGASPEEFDKLVKEQQEIRLEEQKLNEMSGNLNLSTTHYNTQVGELNATVDSFKKELSLRPEEGLYDGKEQEITIYITSSKNELIHTLAHEMGHALGIKHMSNSKSIMFPFSTQEITASSEDEEALRIVCQKQNKFKVFAVNLYSRFQDIVQSFPTDNSRAGVKEAAKVIKVIDGDTVMVLMNNKEEVVRLIGIDTPEVLDERKPVQCFGKQASDKAKEVLNGKIIELEDDSTQSNRDEYGRLLRYILLNNLNFNKLMIDGGFAREYTFKNNFYKHQSEFTKAEKKARESKIGLWSKCSK
ncbi:MAG: hypothetical protein A3C22_02355 [Candidatus Levybacteria bacterium RIFCSPHIGHO2_02_FULL_37_10]|nr:MAG: hypothetical protein A3C22_02355 [Candidatus Levybacteria bacterium RIFCSPHIGHO2_02_FULL_37_10]OGH42374.1 MAG: hypothetical protein A3H79_00665 [Candidatus Levybacteria bacterium RIFCSPLOWO2_02_FULL_36_8b]